MSFAHVIDASETCPFHKYIEANVPESGYVSLIADGQAQDLYAQFGFVHTAPRSVGMAYRRPEQDS
ncbi:hypothetical protein LJR232_003692 [Aquipseudomonas alcaligenes]|uniref:hypothetical protein n=1 Tax=Pseudomonas solani TaxID=2731552 RepID=UPI003D6BA041